MVGLAVAQEGQEKPKTDTSNKLYVDDTAEILAKDDLDELKKIAVGLKRNASARLHFLTGFLKKDTTPDVVSSRLATYSGVGVDDGDDDREALFVVLCERTVNGFIPYTYLIPGKGLEESLTKAQVVPFIDKELRAALNSKEITAETRSKAILSSYGKAVQAVAEDAQKEIAGLSELMEKLLPQVQSLFRPPEGGKTTQTATAGGADSRTRLVPMTDARDPGVPPMYEGALPPKPEYKRYVCDWGDMLTPNDRAYVEQLGQKLDALTTAELVLVTVPTINDGSLNDIAIKTANSWGIGKKGKDNGCLLCVVKDRMLAKKSGKITIQVGYGLEGRLNDAKCGRILDDISLPPFLRGNCTAEEGSSALLQSFEFLAKEIAAEYNVTAESLGINRDFYPQLPVIEEDGKTIHDFAKVLADADMEFIEGISRQLKEKAKATVAVVTIEDNAGVSMSSLITELIGRNESLTKGNAIVLLFSKSLLEAGKTAFGMYFLNGYPSDMLSKERIGRLREKVMEPTLTAEGDKAEAISKAVTDNYTCVARFVADHDKAKLELPEGTVNLKDYDPGIVMPIIMLLIVLVVACIFCPPLLVVVIFPFLIIYHLCLLPFPSGRKKVKEFWKDIGKGGGSSGGGGWSSGRSYSYSSSSRSSSGRSSYGGGSFGGGGASR
ncbi:MAG: TPM domain-containing protein [Victivallales bacterium]|nr:TPM domain-containing protein [Victivallales bacterium]